MKMHLHSHVLPVTKAWQLTLVGLGSLDLKAADFTRARKDYEEALASRNELGEKYTVATTQVAIAELATVRRSSRCGGKTVRAG